MPSAEAMVVAEARSSKGTFFCGRYGVLGRPKMIRCSDVPPFCSRSLSVPINTYRAELPQSTLPSCVPRCTCVPPWGRQIKGLYCIVPAKATTTRGRFPDSLLPKTDRLQQRQSFPRLDVALSPFVYFLHVCSPCLIAFYHCMS
jgi:hypothetical protein